MYTKHGVWYQSNPRFDWVNEWDQSSLVDDRIEKPNRKNILPEW